jgi:hypothetical protein
MHTATDAIFHRLGKALRTENDEFTREPLPQQFVDLIKRLEEKERSRVDVTGCPTQLLGKRLDSCLKRAFRRELNAVIEFRWQGAQQVALAFTRAAAHSARRS